MRGSASGLESGSTAWRAFRLGLMGLLACGAGGCPDTPYYSAPAFFANTTHEPVRVRVFELTAQVSCENLDGHSYDMLAPSAFDAGTLYEVAAGELLPLGYEDEHVWSSVDECGAAVVQAQGLPPLQVFWPKRSCTSQDVLVDADDARARACAVRLEGAGGLQAYAVGSALEGAVESEVPMGVLEPARPFGWSGRVLTGEVVLERVAELPDGCLAVEHSSGAQRSTAYFCVPSWAFPFAAGSSASFALPVVAGTAEKRLTLTTTDATPPIQLSIVLGAVNTSPLNVDFEPLGGGYFTRCGAFVEPLGLRPAGTTTAFVSGDVFDLPTTGIPLRVMAGRSERTLVGPTSCEPEQQALGARFDWLSLTSPVEAP
jgi:hypothetical protein